MDFSICVHYITINSTNKAMDNVNFFLFKNMKCGNVFDYTILDIHFLFDLYA